MPTLSNIIDKCSLLVSVVVFEKVHSVESSMEWKLCNITLLDV
jgi:hypothetical protein